MSGYNKSTTLQLSIIRNSTTGSQNLGRLNRRLSKVLIVSEQLKFT